MYVCMYVECPGVGACVDVCAADGVEWMSKRRLPATGVGGVNGGRVHEEVA